MAIETPDPSPTEASLHDRREVMDLLAGCWTTQVAGALVDLGIADAMADATHSSSSVAAATRCAVEPTRRLLRAAAVLGLVDQEGHDTFALSSKGRLLVSDFQGSLASLARNWTGKRWNAFAQLQASVRSGNPIAQGFNTASPDPSIGIVASEAQVARSRFPAFEAARCYDWSRFGHVLDVGGGHGTVLAAILRQHAAVRGAVFDLPHHAPQTIGFLANEGVADRGRFIGGSFFEGLPAGFDAITLKSILHDWQDGEAIAILRACAAALGAGATLIVIEEILPEIATVEADAASAFRTDLTMLVSTGGLERTERDYRTLLDAAGFDLKQILTTASEFSLIEAIVRDQTH